LKKVNFLMNDILKLLKDSNIKFVARETGIPYARMYKWAIGSAKPKADDFAKLKEYFETGKVEQSKIDHPHQNKSIDELLSIARSEFLEKEQMYRELIAEKDKRLADLEQRIADKDELIKVLKEQNAAKSPKVDAPALDRPL